jgi:probable selenium-dependent hydroxylase accessory protein YqeC
MDPWDAFDLNSSRMIALVGAGGKTSLMFALAALARNRGVPVITTTSTRIYPPTLQQSPALVLTEEAPHFPDRIRDGLSEHGHVTLARTRVEPGKLAGLTMETLDQLPAAFPTSLILIEADGAQGLPLKAPADHEPVIPSATDRVIAVMGLSALDRPLNGGRVFRPEIFARHAGLSPGEPITPEALARALFHPQGLLRAVPPRAPIIPFLNQADTVLPERARETAEELIRAGAGRVARVVWGSVLNKEFNMLKIEMKSNLKKANP